jgi:glycine/D-amino acid oxidase-like deaminating enzyme
LSISYWLDKSNNVGLKELDIAIIGGGIAGLSTAYWLMKEDPSMKIGIIEKGDLGHGATGRNAGFITCGSVEHFNRLVEKQGIKTALGIWNFSEENLRLLMEEIIDTDAEELLFEQKGSFSLASTEQELKELKASASLMEKSNIQIEMLDESEIIKRTGAKGFVGGVKYVKDASIHPIKLLEKLESILLKNGIEFFQNHEVFSIEEKGDGKLIRTQKRNFTTQMTIFATNGFSPLLNPYFKDKIFPTRGQILITSPVERFMEAPCYANFVLDYFRQLPTGQVIIGGFRQLQKDAEIGYSDETSPVIQSALEQFLKEHLPQVANQKITHRWSGIMGFSADGDPMIGALPTDPQTFFIGGFTAHGIGLAFHSGKALVDLLFDRKIPEFISAKRFS